MEVPSPDLAHGFLAGLAALLQASGCAVVYTAAITLRRATGFTTDGQSRRLVTHGIFSLLRHPIAVGLGLVYAGLLAAAPNPWTAFGLAAFTLHQRRQAAAEEHLLRRRFGSGYESYRHRTGRFWPKPGRSPTTTEE
jgi:protein-S-isoprenylcysteine O-methyltransferase Ste14